ncbi:MAG: amino acid ABC transporter permease [Clostridia bacterium]|nr:amino acid ABC transporter permease [Clostridia bacterium]MBR2968989.1 amino acid ABC transporter permease [Clostridia bacterium]
MFEKIIFELLQGFGNTLALFAITLVLSLPLGLLMSFGTMSKFKPLSYLCKGIIWVIRGTPLMLQVLLVSFLPKYLFKVYNKDVAIFLGVSTNTLLFIFVAVAFVINYACYFSEIFRSGIQAISKGQYEAGKVLGLTKTQVFFKVVLMQVVKIIIPPMSNEIITLVKDTALAQILGVVDLLNAAQHAVNNYVILTPLLYAAIFYLIFNGILTLLFGRIEKKLSYYKV